MHERIYSFAFKILFKFSTDWMMSAHIGGVGGIIFIQSVDSNANLFWKHLTDISEIMFYQQFEHPLAQSS